MPEIQYPTNPNSDTAFVVQEDGTKNRALMTAPQDTSTLELPSNANSTKGYVTIDGKKQRVILTADIGGGGSGGTVDYSKTVQKTETMPAADASNAGQVYMYTGATDANFTQNYIYKNVKTATYTGTVSFEPATLSGTTVACSGDNFANFLTESGVEPLSVVSGTMTYDSASELWVLVGKDSDGNTVLTFQEYQQDFVDAGFTFTGTPQDGDVVAFTCTVEEASATYAWTRVDVQPAGATYTAGTGISIDANNEISVTNPVVTNSATEQTALAVGSISNPATASSGAYWAAAVGANASVTAADGVAVGANTSTTAADGVAIGPGARVTAAHAIQISSWDRGTRVTNSVANTVNIANGVGNYRVLEADGTIPEARLADTTNAQQGDVLTLDSTGNAVWQAGGGGGSSYTAGTGININNNEISVADPVLTNKYVPEYSGYSAINIGAQDYTYNSGTIYIGNVDRNTQQYNGNDSVLIGYNISQTGNATVVIGNSASADYKGVAIGNYANSYGGNAAIAIGGEAVASADNAIQLGANGTNSNANTFKVANANGNFEMMNATGNLPADRLASITGLADGNYRLRCTITNGVPTLTWVAE